VPHAGLTRFGKNSWAYRLVRTWIAQGARWKKGSGDIAATLTVTLSEAAKGAKKRMLLPTGKEVEVKIPSGIADGQRLEVRRFHRGFRSGLARPPLIDPKILHDPIHPAVEPGARLELVESPQRPLARALHKVIAIVERPREAVGEASQARQQADKFGSQFLGHPDLPLPIL
jgi:hypothetical protein